MPNLDILCDPELLAIREQHLARLEALYAGERLERAFVLNGINGWSGIDPRTDPDGWVAATLAELAQQAARSRDAHIFRPLALAYGIYGVHFTDAVLGATVVPEPQEGAGGWWSQYLTTPVGALRPPDLSRNVPWQQAQAVARAMSTCGATLPFYTPQILASPLNIAINLYGEEFLLALALEPEAARRDLRVITDTILALTRWYQATLPATQFQPINVANRCQPRGFGQICGCSTQLLSGDSYREFIAPLDAEVLACYPRGGMIHLCGAHTQHLPTWRDMPALRAVQLNDLAAEDFPRYFGELRDDQIIYLNPTDTMTVERALSISSGQRLVLVIDLPEAPKLR